MKLKVETSIWLLIFTGIFLIRDSLSQDFKKFSGNPGAFISEISGLMKPNISAADEALLQEFINIWRIDSLYTAEEQLQIVKISELLLAKKAKSNPHFSNYLQCLVYFKRKNQTPVNFQQWITGITNIADNRKIPLSTLNNLFTFTTQFIDSAILYQSTTVKWKSSNSQYKITTDSGFAVIIGKTNLICSTRFDSISIFETQGTFYPVENRWQGIGGIVTWERAAFNKDSVYASLSEYSIDMKRSEYKAEQVTFINRNYFDNPLKGNLIDKVQRNKTPADADYPKFFSYQRDFSIKNLYKDINYEGGLSMQGAKLVGTGTADEPAAVYIFRKDTLVIKAYSDYFAFKSDRINSPMTSIVIKIKEDSIYHPGLAFSFKVPTRELSLSQTDNFISHSPYYNSYHNVDMTFEQLVWKMDQPYMRFTAAMGSSIGIANFESVNIFDYNKFAQLQCMDEVHPLISIRSFSRHLGMEQFRADDFADYLNKPLAQVKQMLMRMAAMGFVFYNINTDMVTIKPRLHDYLAASVSKIDYDVISFPSRTEAPLDNAVFDLRNFDLTIYGIPKIFVSDSQNVVIYPAKDKIILKKDRDFLFDGTLTAGLLTFYGHNFFFHYDSFKIRLQHVDSLYIRYLTGKIDNYGFQATDDANNLIEDVTGDLYIDKPDNKSGRKSYPEYPIFKSMENSYVYYNRPDIQSGAYKSDNFYYMLYPFTMDSLDNFNRESMVFDGELHAAGILPVIKEPLRLQSDKSLGFTFNTGPEGLPLYEGKGKYTQSIQLSNQGLRGQGRVDYLTASILSDNLMFYPDSMNAVAKEFTIAEKTTETEFPQVRSANNYIHWLPYKDELYAYKKDVSFSMFNDAGTLAGDLKLQPSGLTGSGKMDLKNSDLQSEYFTYKSKEIIADTADFYLKSVHSDGFTVLTDNVKARIDYNSRMGYFNSNEDFTMVNFPENKYVSYLDYFIWNMNEKELAMGSNKTFSSAGADTSELIGPRYISIDPKQDSLNFISPLAYYDYDSNLIKATQVKYIDIADARIFPDQEKLTVKSNAMLKTLENAKIIANRNTLYHSFYNATVNITSRNAYYGKADYDYIDELDQRQVIHFKTIQAERNQPTTAKGDIVEVDHFRLSPNYAYQGKVFLSAERKYLTFDGAVLIETNCEQLPMSWVNFQSEIDPFNIYIPLADPLIDINRNKIFNGIFVAYDSIHLYPAFMSERKNYSDKPIVTAGGYLNFDKTTNEYRIASKDKLHNPAAAGNYLSLHRENCELYGEGKMNLGANLGQVKLTSTGNGKHNVIQNKTELDIILGMDFYIDPNIINIMAAEIDSMPNLPAVDLTRPAYTKAVTELIGREKLDALRTELSLFGTVKELPAELKHTIMFNDLKLQWNDESNSYLSVGKIGIASINNRQINKLVDGLIEIQLKRSGDICDIYLQIDRNTWYYFGYTRGVMQIHSSNRAFLDKMIAMKPNERRQKVTSGESYIYMVSTDMKKNEFIRRYREVLEQRSQENQEDK